MLYRVEGRRHAEGDMAGMTGGVSQTPGAGRTPSGFARGFGVSAVWGLWRRDVLITFLA